ncbi:MAG TPA: hypothetical protein V6C93_34190 [Allocoleopsis sp.]
MSAKTIKQAAMLPNLKRNGISVRRPRLGLEFSWALGKPSYRYISEKDFAITLLDEVDGLQFVRRRMTVAY